jgi:hypothetical protein
MPQMSLEISDTYEYAIHNFKKVFLKLYPDFMIYMDHRSKSKYDEICTLYYVHKKIFFKFLKCKPFASISKSNKKFVVNDFDIAEQMATEIDVCYSQLVKMAFSAYHYQEMASDHPYFNCSAPSKSRGTLSI